MELKPIVISVRRQKVEIWYFLVSFVIANGLNVYSIIEYSKNWGELYSLIGYVFALTCLFYIVSIVLRLLAYGITLPFRKRKTSESI